MIAEIIIILVLIVLNGFFSMAEIAVVSSRKSKLEMKAEGGNEGAKAAFDLSNRPDKFLSTIQVGITLIGILTGVFGGASISEKLAAYFNVIGFFPEYSNSISMTIVVIVITFLSLVIGELFPKRIGLSNPEAIAALIARPMDTLSKICSPIVWLLSKSTDLLSKLFRVKMFADNYITQEEIKVMVDQASDVGEVQKAERDIVERVFFLGDTDVGSLMTPRHDIVALDILDDFEENKKIIIDSIHTNFIVYERDIDQVVGILNLKQLVPAALQTCNADLRELLSPPLFVPEKTKAFSLLESMKTSKTHFAIATNEYGSVTGIVTMNDLFKALVGNLYNQVQEPEIIEREDGTYLVDALVSLDEFFHYFEIEDTADITDKGFFTLGGLILYLAKNIPKENEKFKWRNLTFEIVDMDGNRVDKLIVRKVFNKNKNQIDM